MPWETGLIQVVKCFADHLNPLLLIFLSFSFILLLLNINVKRMYLIQNLLFLKDGSNTKYFNFFVFYFNIFKKIFTTSPQLLNFQELFYLQPPW